MKYPKEYLQYLAKDALDNWNSPDIQQKLVQLMFTTGIDIDIIRSEIQKLSENK
jgi:hypothetical protein